MDQISIDGHTEISFTEDVAARYEALGWHVIHVKDGNTDYDAIRKAIDDAKKVTDKPTLIKARQHSLPDTSASWTDASCTHTLTVNTRLRRSHWLSVTKDCVTVYEPRRTRFIHRCAADSTGGVQTIIDVVLTHGVLLYVSVGFYADRLRFPQQGRHPRRARRAPGC